jgi:hypothetical protein
LETIKQPESDIESVRSDREKQISKSFLLQTLLTITSYMMALAMIAASCIQSRRSPAVRDVPYFSLSVNEIAKALSSSTLSDYRNVHSEPTFAWRSINGPPLNVDEDLSRLWAAAAAMRSVLIGEAKTGCDAMQAVGLSSCAVDTLNR